MKPPVVEGAEKIRGVQENVLFANTMAVNEGVCSGLSLNSEFGKLTRLGSVPRLRVGFVVTMVAAHSSSTLKVQL